VNSTSDSKSQPIAIAVAPRLLAKLATSLPEGQDHSGPPIGEPVWSDTQLALGDFRAGMLKNLFTGEACNCEQPSLSVAAALANFPVALLTNVG
jgi:maltooligosyltrehalose synthase